jgi:uncharacterized protein (DUF2342 family)
MAAVLEVGGALGGAESVEKAADGGEFNWVHVRAVERREERIPPVTAAYRDGVEPAL